MRTKFKKGDVAVDFDANQYEVVRYEWSDMYDEMLVRIKNIETGSIYLVNEDDLSLWRTAE